MKKSFIGTLCGLIIFVFSATSAKAQGFTGGAKLGWDIYFGSNYKPISLGGFGEYIREEENSGVRGMIEFALPSTIKDDYIAFATNSTTNPQNISITGETKVSTINFCLDYKRYFKDGDYSDGGFYGFLGAGATLISAQTTYNYGSYSREDYTVTNYADEEEKQKYFQLMLRGGIGYELDLDMAKLFFESRLSFPANQVNGMYVDINIGPFAGFSAGIRF